MAKIALDLSQFKSAGVYTVEVDQSERIQVTTQTLRLVPGFSARGPYNAPVFIRSTKDLYRIFGTVDTKLERKGSFFHRTIETCLLTAPVFAINLLKVSSINAASNTDKLSYSILSLDTSTALDGILNKQDASALQSPYVNFFNRERFWSLDEDFLQGVANNAVGAVTTDAGPLMSIVNIGGKDISLIVRKASGLTGYGVTATDWYGSAQNIPYEWIRPYDLMEDYFLQIIAVDGNWTKYNSLAADPYWSQFFTNTTDASGLIPSKVGSFINSDNVGLLGSWTGTIIPDFKDQTGTEQYLPTIMNNSTQLTGLFLTINRDALDQLTWDDDENKWENGDGTDASIAPYLVDLVGHNWADDASATITNVNINFLSYNIDVSIDVFHPVVSVTAYTDGSIAATGKQFFLDASTDNTYVQVGAFVVSGAEIQPGLTPIVNKYRVDSSIVFETEEPILGGAAATTATIQLPIEDASVNKAYKFITLNGFKLKNQHLPGYDTAGAKNAEAGVSKIYGMLHDDGILRGLTNKDMINYRYIVDTMAYGLGKDLGGKQYLSSLAKKRGKCTALINAPSMKQLASSQNPYFVDTFVPGVDPNPVFNTKWIPSGGNPDMPRTFRFTLPTEELGSKYMGLFGPFLKYNENGKLIDVPPAGDVSNSYARKFLGGDPFAIVANRNGILSNPKLVGLEYKIDQTDRDYLEPWGYNSIIERPATSQIMIYSNATGYQTVKSDYNSLHVRELLNTLEIQISEVLEDYVFDFNNAVTRLNIVNSVSPILEATKDAGAIYKYELVMDETNNTPQIIQDGFGIVDIGLWVTGALTKIVAQFTVNSEGGVSTGGFTG